MTNRSLIEKTLRDDVFLIDKKGLNVRRHGDVPVIYSYNEPLAIVRKDTKTVYLNGHYYTKATYQQKYQVEEVATSDGFKVEEVDKAQAYLLAGLPAPEKEFSESDRVSQTESRQVRSSTSIKGDEAVIESSHPDLNDIPGLLQTRKLDPDEWVVDSVTVNEWGDSGDPNTQMKLTLTRKVATEPIMAPRTTGTYIRSRPKFKAERLDGEQLVVIVGDQQAPWVDWALHDCFLQWLQRNRPSRGISLGDTYDFPDIRPGHRVHPRHTAVVNECLQVGYDVLRGYVESSEDTLWIKMIGNHDERIQNILLDTLAVRPLAEVQRPVDDDGGGEYIHSLAHAGRLDELGIEVLETGGAYELGQINLSKHLAVRHGWIARKGSGTTALATLEHLRYSVVVGHTHRQSIVYKTTADIDGKINTLTAAEAGCMCRVDQTPDDTGRAWPGYSVAPDWQQGFMTATIYPDGKFHLDPAVFVNDTLMWRDQRYNA